MTLEIPDECVAMVRIPYQCDRLVKLMDNLEAEHGEQMLVTADASFQWMIFVKPVTEPAGKSAHTTAERGEG